MNFDLEKLKRQFSKQTYNNPKAGFGAVASHEIAYKTGLTRKYVKPVTKDIEKALKPLIKENPQLTNSIQLNNSKQSLVQQTNNILNNLKHDWQTKVVEDLMLKTATQVVEEENNFNRKKFIRNVNNAIGVDITNILKDSGIEEELEKHIDENFELIKSMPEQQIEKTRLKLANLMITGDDDFNLEKMIFDTIESTDKTAKWRARLISRDQISKINGNLSELMQKDIGVTKYVWRTSVDERVRKTHRHNNNKIFRWDSPPDTGHPSHDVQCRCYADPYFKDVTIVGEPEQSKPIPQVTPPKPKKKTTATKPPKKKPKPVAPVEEVFDSTKPLNIGDHKKTTAVFLDELSKKQINTEKAKESLKKKQQMVAHRQKVLKQYEDAGFNERTISRVKGGLEDAKAGLARQQKLVAKKVAIEKKLTDTQQYKDIKSHKFTPEETNKLMIETEDIIVNNSYETGIVYDDSGQIQRNKGTKKAVSFEYEQWTKHEGKTFTHNHPKREHNGLGGNFSSADINSHISAGLKETRAVDEVYTYSIKGGLGDPKALEKYLKGNKEPFRVRSNLANQVAREFKNASLDSQKVMNDYYIKQMRENKPVDWDKYYNLWFDTAHEKYKVIANRHGLKYSRVKRVK